MVLGMAETMWKVGIEDEILFAVWTMTMLDLINVDRVDSRL